MRSAWRFGARVAALSALLIMGIAAVAGCATLPTAIFRPESPQAAAIQSLDVILLAIAGIVFVGVEGFLIVSVVIFRNRPEEGAQQTHGNVRLETGWTIATAVVIFVILGLTVKTMAEVTALPAPAASARLPMASAFPGDTVLLKSVGQQWWWTFEYPNLDIVTANEAHVPVAKTVKLQLESADVIHSFWAPRLAGKTDMIPGHVNYSSFLAAQPGVYYGECAEFCGAEHARMGFLIVAESSAGFADWVRAQQAQAAQPATGVQREGHEKYLRSCAACHTARGTAAAGKLGPDLTHFGSRRFIAANTMENTPQNLARWLRDPQEVKPDNKMPNLQLDQATIDQLVVYLEHLK